MAADRLADVLRDLLRDSVGFLAHSSLFALRWVTQSVDERALAIAGLPDHEKALHFAFGRRCEARDGRPAMVWEAHPCQTPLPQLRLPLRRLRLRLRLRLCRRRRLHRRLRLHPRLPSALLPDPI